MLDLYTQLDEQLIAIEREGQRRSLVPVTHLDRGRIAIDGRPFLNLAGNDYLGLATNRALLTAFYHEQNATNLLEQYGLGSTASRLMTGNTEPYVALERMLADLYRSFCMVFQDFLDHLIADVGVNRYQDHIHNGLLDAITRQDADEAARFAMEGLDHFTSDIKALEQ